MAGDNGRSDDYAPVVHLSELAQFTRQLGAMLQAGIDILRALEVASRQSGNPRLIQVSRDLRETLADGRLFADAAGRYPEIFSPFYIQMTRQGERDGVLGPALLSLADYLDQELQRGPASMSGGAAASSLASVLLLLFGLGALGAAGMLFAGQTLAWGANTLPAVLLWLGSVLTLGALWLAWRASSGPSFCAGCGRPLPPVRKWHLGPRMCNACVRTQVARLKTRERARQEAESLVFAVQTTSEPTGDKPPTGADDEGVGKRFQL